MFCVIKFKHLERKVKDEYFKERCDILTDLVNKKGIDLNSLAKSTLLIDIYPEYKGTCYSWLIGLFLFRARKNNYPEYNETLKSLGFKFEKYVQPVAEQKKNMGKKTYTKKDELSNILIFLSRAKGVDLNSIAEDKVLKEILPEYKGKHVDWQIGRFLSESCKGKFESYHDLLRELGFSFQLIKLHTIKIEKQREKGKTQ